MARLPGAEALGERPTPVLPRRTPLVADYRATSGLEEFSAQVLGHSASELQQAAGIAMQMQEQHDTVRAEDAFNQLRKRQIDMTFGKEGFANLKGGDAANRPLLKEYGGAFDGAAAQLAAGLDNDYQRQLFTKRSQVAGIQMREDVARHVAQQSDVYADTVFRSKLDVEAKAAGARWAAPDAAAVPLLNIDNAIDAQARRLGLAGNDGQAWVDDMRMKARSNVYSNMVKQAMASDPVNGPFIAQKIMADHAGEISPDMKAVLSHEINTAIRPIQARRDAQAVISGTVLPSVVVALQTGGQPVDANLVAQEAGGEPATYRFRLADGTIEEGTASSARVAAKYGATITGKAVPQTKAATQANLGEWIAAAEAQAERTHPGDILYRDAVVQNVKGYVGTIVAAQEGQQKAHYQQLVGALLPTPENQRPPTTMDELMAAPANRAAYFALDPSQQSGVIGMLQHNLQRSLGAPIKSDGKVVTDLAARIFLPAEDTNRIRNIGQLIPFFGVNADGTPKGLDQASYNFLGGLIDKANSVNGNKIAREIQRTAASARSKMLSSIWAVDKDATEDAAVQFNIDLQRKVDEYTEAGKDVRPLFTPGSADYVLTPGKWQSYLQSPQQAVAGAAQAAVGNTGRILTISNEAEFETLPPGAKYRGPNDPLGKFRTKPLAAPAPAQAQVVRAKGDIPTFRAGIDPQDQENHIGGLWAAAKAVGGFGSKVVTAPADLILMGVRGVVNAVLESREPDYQAKASRAMFKVLLKRDMFTISDVPVIEAAIKYADLDPADMKKAQEMLRIVRGEG